MAEGSAQDAAVNDVGAKLVYSVTEAAALLSVGRTTVYQLIGSGELRSVKIGTRRLVARRDLEAYVQALCSAGLSDAA
jgi:excisionase family DNA binding protein